MTWSARHQLKIIAIVVLFAAVPLVALLYKTLSGPQPNCFDGIQNADEVGVDCGGSCNRICSFQAKDIVALWERPVEVLPGTYSAVAYLENQNPAASAESVAYEMKLYDEDNVLVGRPRTGVTFLAPNERTAIFEGGIQTGNAEAKTALFRFTEPIDWQQTPRKFLQPLIRVNNRQFEQIETRPRLRAELVSLVSFDLRDIPVTALIYDTESNLIAASETIVDFLPRLQSQSVLYTWPNPFSANVGKIEILPRVNPFIQN